MKFISLASLLAVLFLVGCALSPGAYPHFWDYPPHEPKEADIIGAYKGYSVGSVQRIQGFHPDADIRLMIRADHTALLTGIPAFDGFGERQKCSYSGPAKWRLYDDTDMMGYLVEFDIDLGKGRKACASGWGLVILGRHAPHRLYLTIGDPDSDQGIEFAKTER